MKKTFLLSLTILLFAFGCQQELDADDLIYRGDWDSPTYALQIYSNGYGVCNTRKWGGAICEGFVKIKNNHILFTSNTDNSTLGRKRFRINQAPTIDADGTTYMVLDGERFERH